MMLHYEIVITVVLVGLPGMHKIGCSGGTQLVLHILGSSRAGKRLTINIIIIIVIIIITLLEAQVQDESVN